jgi:hypothetical protein
MMTSRCVALLNTPLGAAEMLRPKATRLTTFGHAVATSLHRNAYQIVNRHGHHIECLQGFRASDRSVLVDALLDAGDLDSELLAHRFAAEVVPGFGGVDSPNSFRRLSDEFS